MIRLSGWKRACNLFVMGAATIIAAQAQTVTTLVSFDGTDGDKPQYESLIQGTDGNFYGVTYQGGANGLGTIFKMTPAGAVTVLYNMADTDGFYRDARPTSTLLQASDGNFYGTTRRGGPIDCGFIYKITPAGTESKLYDFCYTAGVFDRAAPSTPYSGLIQGTDGYLYGTSSSGGDHFSGTVFRISLSGVLTVLHSFYLYDDNSTSGITPVGRLVQGTDGNLYGTTGTTIYRVNPNGSGYETAHAIDRFAEGFLVDAGLTLGKDGNFYGTASGGGVNLTGSVFRMTPAGVFTVLYTFSAAGTEGSAPDYCELVQAGDGNFYGTTSTGGKSGNGTVFKITPAGAFTSLYSFGISDGGTPEGGLTLGSDGNLYGTTSIGGANLHGTVFKLTTGGGVTTPPGGPPPAVTGVVSDASFKAGAPVTSGSWVAIFGTNLAPAGDSRQWNPATEIVNGKLPTSLDGTSVTMNGKPAVVNFISPTQVNVQPPDDTAVGPVQVVVATAAGPGPAFTATYSQFAPGLFPATSPYIAAQHSDNTYVGGYTGATSAKPGEVIILWGSGFGPASPAVPAGQVFNGANKLANPVTVTIGGQPAAVDFAGVVGAGLVQINVHVPTSISNGDAAVVASVGGVATQATGNMISIGAGASNPASVVTPSVTPNPVYQGKTDADGYSWFFTVKLTETAGVATTLTGFTFATGSATPFDLTSSIAAIFGSGVIPANGTLLGNMRSQVTPPANVTLGFAGVDASGTKWTKQIVVPFLAAQ